MATKTKAKYTSKGERRSVATKVGRSEFDKALAKQAAFLAGKRVWFTVDNPTPNTNKAKIRVLGKDLYGDFRKMNERHIIR